MARPAAAHNQDQRKINYASIEDLTKQEIAILVDSGIAQELADAWGYWLPVKGSNSLQHARFEKRLITDDIYGLCDYTDIIFRNLRYIAQGKYHLHRGDWFAKAIDIADLNNVYEADGQEKCQKILQDFIEKNLVTWNALTQIKIHQTKNHSMAFVFIRRAVKACNFISQGKFETASKTLREIANEVNPLLQCDDDEYDDDGNLTTLEIPRW